MIVPDVVQPLGIEDQEKNGVYKIVVMRKFTEDIIKAFRRNAVVGKPFDYNH